MGKHVILVTGGAGFIGSHVVDAYIAAGHQVIVIDDLSSGNPDFVNEQAAFHEMDIRSAQLEDIFEQYKPGIVNHHAAQIDVRKSLQDPLYDADVNIKGSLNLLEMCVQFGVKKFIFASTGGAIYGSPQQLPADESCEPQPESHYGASKYCVEQYVRLYHRLYHLPHAVLRYPNVYGPRQSPHGEAGVCAILAGLMLRGESPTLYGDGKPLRDYVYVTDIAKANVAALNKAPNATINLGSGIGVSVLQLFDALKALSGFSGRPVLKPLRKGEVDRIYITGTRAGELLGWSPSVSLEAGLENTLEFVRSQQVTSSKNE